MLNQSNNFLAFYFIFSESLSPHSHWLSVPNHFWLGTAQFKSILSPKNLNMLICLYLSYNSSSVRRGIQRKPWWPLGVASNEQTKVPSNLCTYWYSLPLEVPGKPFSDVPTPQVLHLWTLRLYLSIHFTSFRSWTKSDINWTGSRMRPQLDFC